MSSAIFISDDLVVNLPIPLFTGRHIFSLLAGRDDLEVVRATIGGSSSDLDQRHIP